jgi:hypothetical protein
MDKYYTLQDIERLFKKTRTTALKMAQNKGWIVVKEKVDKVYKNLYLKEEVDRELGIIVDEQKAKMLTRTVKKNEAKNIDELPNWNQRVANSRYILCIKLEEAYEEKLENKDVIIKEFVANAREEFPQQMEILKNLSIPTLRRWYGIYKKNRDNPLALASGHGANKGLRRVNKEVLEMTKKLYFSKNKPQMTVVWQKIVEMFGIDAISYGTLRNFLNNDVNIIEKDRARMGAKEFKDTHSTFIIRGLQDVKAGDVWMADGHTLDFQCYRGKKKKANKQRDFGRPTLIAWLDLKSRMVVGYTLSWTENTEAVAIALKRAIEKYGVPKKIYTDNGKAFKNKILKGTEELEGLYASLGIEVTHARPYNAQAKEIERYFRDLKENFSKMFGTYLGGNIVERPEHMKTFAQIKMAKGALLEEEHVEMELAKYIDYKNHLFYEIRRAGGMKAHRGRGMENRTPLEVFNEEYPVENRVMLSDEKLRRLFLYEEMKTVQQNGITFMGNTYEHEALYYHQTERVRIKYDPHNLSELYVYLDTGEFLCKARKLVPVGFNDITGIKINNYRKKKIKEYGEKILDLTVAMRDDSNILTMKDVAEAEVIEVIEDKTGKKKQYIGNGLYVEID